MQRWHTHIGKRAMQEILLPCNQMGHFGFAQGSTSRAMTGFEADRIQWFEHLFEGLADRAE